MKTKTRTVTLESRLARLDARVEELHADNIRDNERIIKIAGRVDHLVVQDGQLAQWQAAIEKRLNTQTEALTKLSEKLAKLYNETADREIDRTLKDAGFVLPPGFKPGSPLVTKSEVVEQAAKALGIPVIKQPDAPAACTNIMLLESTAHHWDHNEEQKLTVLVMRLLAGKYTYTWSEFTVLAEDIIGLGKELAGNIWDNA